MHWLGNATEAPLSPDVTKKNAETKSQVPEREQSFHRLGMRGRLAGIRKAQGDFNRRKSRAEAPKASVLTVSLLEKKMLSGGSSENSTQQIRPYWPKSKVIIHIGHLLELWDTAI